MFRPLKAAFWLSFFIFYFAASSEIKWYTFEEGLKKAKEEHKLILMDIYAKWCHWCNVIENTTYRDKEVIELIKKYYIPVRVDAEKRPDINKKYNQGGLPSTLILDSSGNIIFGAIYVSPDEMRKILLHYAKMSKEDIQKEVERVKLQKELKFKIVKRRLKEKKVSPEEIHKIFKYVKLVYDYQYGSLKGAPKFPKTDLPYFLELYWLIFDNQEAKKLAQKTLYAYANLIDKVEGGIYRYSVNEYWTEFHYEKLLKDQAQLSILYFNSYSLFQNREFLKYANMLLNFAKAKLYDKNTGYFFNSQGADIVDENGTLLVTGEEYFSKDKTGRQIIKNAVGYAPNIEKSIYYGNNLLMARALLYSYVFNNNKEDFKTGKSIIDKIVTKHFTTKGIPHSEKINEYYLSNQVYFIQALLELYQLTANKSYLENALKMTQILDKYYYSKNLGIYVDLKDTGLNLKNISFIDDVFQLNQKLTTAFYKLYMFTGDQLYLKKAMKIVKKLPKKGKLSTGIAYFVYLYPPLVSYTVGYEKDKDKFIKNLFRVFPYYHYPLFISYKDKKILEKLGYSPEKDKTVVYLCNSKMCFEKLTDISKPRRAVLKVFEKYKLMN